MTALAQPDFFTEHAWLIGEDEEPKGLSPAARRLRETRIMATVFKRR